MLEAIGRYGERAATELHATGWRVHVANPRRIKDHARSLGQRNKAPLRIECADAADARKLPSPL